MKEYNVESLRTALAEFLEVSKDFGQSYKVALLVDKDTNVECSGILTNNEFMTDEESVLTYLETFDLWEGQNMNEWLYNEIGGKITKEEINSVLLEMVNKQIITDEEYLDFTTNVNNKQVLDLDEYFFSLHNIGYEFFNSDIMEDKQEELLKYWEQEYLIPEEISRLEDLVSYKLEQEEINKERYEQMQKEAEEDDWL